MSKTSVPSLTLYGTLSTLSRGCHECKETEEHGGKYDICPVPDNDLIGVDSLYSDPFPAASLDEYHIPDRQKTPGDDMAIVNYEPMKKKDAQGS